MSNKVSIIVPVYNVSKYLAICIDSILKQTYKNLEIIFVNDGSTDNSLDILQEYKQKDDRIVVIDKKNGGVSSARNEGIKACTGDFICFADSDDILMEDYVQYLFDLLLSNSSDIALTTNMFSNFDSVQVKNDVIKNISGEEATIGILSYNIPIGVYCKLFKKELIKDKDVKFLENIFIGEGFNFNTAAFQRADKVTAGKRKIYFYRRDNPTSATTKFSIKKWENGLFAIDQIKNDFILHSDSLTSAWKFARWRTYTDVYDIMVLANAQNDYHEMFKKCKKVIRKDAYYAFLSPTSKMQRCRALIMFIYPKVIPLLMIYRRKKYNAEV